MRKISYGINTQNRSMYPCTKEVAQTVAVCHKLGTIVYGLKYKQREKRRKKYSEDIDNSLSSMCHDASVVIYNGTMK